MHSFDQVSLHLRGRRRIAADRKLLRVSRCIRVQIQLTAGTRFSQFGLHVSARLGTVVGRGADAAGGNRRLRILLQFTGCAGAHHVALHLLHLRAGHAARLRVRFDFRAIRSRRTIPARESRCGSGSGEKQSEGSGSHVGIQ